MPNEKNEFIMLGGLWLSKSKSGEMYMSGRLGLGGKILIFKNKSKKDEDNQPDYYMFLANWQRQEGESDEEGDDDIPF